MWPSSSLRKGLLDRRRRPHRINSLSFREVYAKLPFLGVLSTLHFHLAVFLSELLGSTDSLRGRHSTTAENFRPVPSSFRDHSLSLSLSLSLSFSRSPYFGMRAQIKFSWAGITWGKARKEDHGVRDPTLEIPACAPLGTRARESAR